MRCCARAWVLLLLIAATARAQPSPSSEPVRLLDVPYLQQSESLCGGAAAAMVMRYWGATGVYAETFAPLVDKTAGGIRGEDLLRDLTNRGWEARSFRGDPALIKGRLAAGQPVIALIEDRPGAFHYVVIVAWANERVVHHDPARAPFRVTPEGAFLKAWAATSNWTMLALPRSAGVASVDRAIGSSADRIGSSADRACDGLVDVGVRIAGTGDHEAALRTLGAAADACPADSGPWREMAGVYALKQSWKAAAAHAREAVRRDPTDMHAWRILATSSFVTDDTATALEAWNALGEPTLDIVNIQGLEHTRHSAASAALRLQPETRLTRAALSAAGKRLAELPAARLARVNYRPLENGRVAVDAVVIERPRSPFSPLGLAVAGIRTVSTWELTLAAANPTGGGDLVTASWRWWENRPRIAASYAAPMSFGGVLQTDVFRDEQTYGDVRVREVRKGGGAALSDWTTTDLRWEAGIGVDNWDEQGKTVTLSGALEQRLMSDHLSLQASASALAGGFGSWSSGAGVEWRSALRHEGHIVLLRAGADLAGTDAPLALWPGAGLGHARRTLLRAHPLVADGVITGDAFGRRLYAANGEWRRWLRPVKRALRLAPAAFVDSAYADRRLEPGDAWHVDVGVGLRVAIPGSQVLRVDLARGLRDGQTVFSVGWTR